MFTKGQFIPGKFGQKWVVLNVTPKQITIGFYGNITRTYTFCWDGTGYKRQGQYLTIEGIK